MRERNSSIKLKPISLDQAQEMVSEVKKLVKDEAELIEVAGSVRRKKEIVGDLDFAVIPKDKEKFWKRCREVFGEPILGGKADSSKGQFIYKDVGLDFYMTDAGHFEPMMLFLTGSAALNIYMRAIAKAKGLALSQYGLVDRKTEIAIGEQTERGIFETLGLKYLSPEDRSLSDTELRKLR